MTSKGAARAAAAEESNDPPAFAGITPDQETTVQTIIDFIKNRLGARRISNASLYWTTLERAASADSLSDRAMGSMLDAIEGTLPALGKTAADVEADLELLREHAAARAEAQASEQAKAEAGELRADALRQERRAQELIAEAERLRTAAEVNRQRANATTDGASRAAQELGRTRRALALAGHPGFGAAATDAAKVAEVESLRGELSNLDAGMIAGDESPVARRATIAARLRELGRPIDDADDDGEDLDGIEQGEARTVAP